MDRGSGGARERSWGLGAPPPSPFPFPHHHHRRRHEPLVFFVCTETEPKNPRTGGQLAWAHRCPLGAVASCLAEVEEELAAAHVLEDEEELLVRAERALEAHHEGVLHLHTVRAGGPPSPPPPSPPLEWWWWWWWWCGV